MLQDDRNVGLKAEGNWFECKILCQFSRQHETDREISLERNLFTTERLKSATSGVNILSIIILDYFLCKSGGKYFNTIEWNGTLITARERVHSNNGGL